MEGPEGSLRFNIPVIRREAGVEAPEEYEISYLMDLPEELLVGTEENPGPLVELAFPELMRLREVSRKFKHLIDNNDYFWKLKTQRDFEVEDRYPETGTWKAEYFRYSGVLAPKLINAVKAGNANLVRRLLDLGADPNTASRRFRDHRRTALMLASLGGHLEIVDLLLAAGANVDDRSANKNTALMFASSRGHLPIVKRLLAAGADVDVVGYAGRTALQYALDKRYSEITATLRAAGAQGYFRAWETDEES